MKSSTLRKRGIQAAGLAIFVFALLVIGVSIAVVRSEREAEVLRAELAVHPEHSAVRTEAERARIVGLARATRSPTTAPSMSKWVAAPAASTPASPPRDTSDDDGAAEVPLHDWLRDVRLTRTQPGPAPPPEVLARLADLAPGLDALAELLVRDDNDNDNDGPAPLVEPGDGESRYELERARALLLAAACAESLVPARDPVRGQRLLEAAWTLGRGLPAVIDDAGPGDLFLAVMRQVRVADVRAWNDRIGEMEPRARLVDALEWDAKSRLVRLERTAERRRQVEPGWVPASVQLFLGAVATKHDTVFLSGISAAEVELAREVRALDACDDPWRLETFTKGPLGIDGPGPPGEGRLRLALASASLQQSDAALTRHVLLRRHGLEAPRDRCGMQPLVERPEGGNRFLVGWRVPGRDEPGSSDRDRPRNHSTHFRTWPEPSLPGPPLVPFSFEVASPGPVLASAPAP